MPRTSDHAARRALAVRAVRSVAVKSGLGSVTIARAAAEAQVSVGLIQHYYATKEDLLVEAFTDVRRQIEERVDASIQEAEKRHERIEEIMLAALTELLPADRRRREESYLALAFAGLALDNTRLRAALESSEDHMRARISTAVANGKECGEVDAATDPDEAALAVWALTQGMVAQLHSQSEPDFSAARRGLAMQLRQVFPGKCSRAGR